MSRSADASDVTSLKHGDVASAWLTASAQPSAQMGSDAIESNDSVIFVTSRIAASSGLHASKTRFASSSAVYWVTTVAADAEACVATAAGGAPFIAKSFCSSCISQYRVLSDCSGLNVLYLATLMLLHTSSTHQI